jgi:large subunit ribosomal protein L17
MRHRKKFNHLSRTSAHRKAMLSNMATSLILHKRITTTVAKAKALRTYVEPIITRSKEDTTHSRRMVFSYLQSKEAVTELFREISIKVANRPGGYTRIIKMGNRLGDNADMCLIELVDYNDLYLAKETKTQKESGRRRRRRGSGSSAASEKTVQQAVDQKHDDTSPENSAEVSSQNETVETDSSQSEEVDAKVEEKEVAAEQDKTLAEDQTKEAVVDEAETPVSEESKESESADQPAPDTDDTKKSN